MHKIIVPFIMQGNYTVKSIVAAGTYKVTDTIAVVTDSDNNEYNITMVQKWPVKQAIRCYTEKPRPSRVMETGVRAIDTFNPLAEGGTGFIPGPFGAGTCGSDPRSSPPFAPSGRSPSRSTPPGTS